MSSRRLRLKEEYERKQKRQQCLNPVIHPLTLDDKTWLTVKKAAKYLGVCRRTIDNYIGDGLSYAQPRKIRYINREDLDAWVEEHRVEEDLDEGA